MNYVHVLDSLTIKMQGEITQVTIKMQLLAIVLGVLLCTKFHGQTDLLVLGAKSPTTLIDYCLCSAV